MTHIGSGYAAEADASLDVLSDLVESHPDVMAPFAIFIKVSPTLWQFQVRVSSMVEAILYNIASW